MLMKRLHAAVAVFSLFCLGFPGMAAAKPKPAETAVRAKALQDLTQCRAIAEDQARLACFDRAAAAFDEAEKAGDIVVVDKAQATEVKRQAFGLNLNSALSMFDRGAHADKVDRVTMTVGEVKKTADGKWMITTTEGQIWRQIDSDPLDLTPKAGDTVVVSRGSLGSFFVKIGHNRDMRAHRDQ
jgi:hypothetical protein